MRWIDHLTYDELRDLKSMLGTLVMQKRREVYPVYNQVAWRVFWIWNTQIRTPSPKASEF